MTDIPPQTAIDPREMRACCGRFATSVTVVTTRSPDGDHGMTVSAFMSVSLDPPLIGIAMDRRAKTLAKVQNSKRFAVNILSQDMSRHALHFAGRTDGTLTDLFSERHGMPVLRDAAAFLVADVTQQVDAGDHALLIGKVQHLSHDPAAAPLLHHAGQFGRLVYTEAMRRGDQD